MTNTMIAIFAQIIKSWNIVQPIVMDIVNIKAVEMYAKIVHIYLNVQKAKSCETDNTTYMGKLYGAMWRCSSYFGNEKLYEQRKETIERIFGTAKENHGFRYTQMYGKARMEMKVGLTFACMNLKN